MPTINSSLGVMIICAKVQRGCFLWSVIFVFITWCWYQYVTCDICCRQHLESGSSTGAETFWSVALRCGKYIQEEACLSVWRLHRCNLQNAAGIPQPDFCPTESCKPIKFFKFDTSWLLQLSQANVWKDVPVSAIGRKWMQAVDMLRWSLILPFKQGRS